MAAQNGQAVTLGYGNQGVRQNGAAVVLDYQAGTVTGAINRSVKSGVRGTWHKADSKIIALFSPQPASNPQDHSRLAVWLLPDPIAASAHAPWTPPVHQDTSQATLWGKYDQRRNDDKNSLWKKSASR